MYKFTSISTNNVFCSVLQDYVDICRIFDENISEEEAGKPLRLAEEARYTATGNLLHHVIDDHIATEIHRAFIHYQHESDRLPPREPIIESMSTSETPEALGNAIKEAIESNAAVPYPAA